MAFIVAILAGLALASPLNAYQLPSSGSGQLARDFQAILDLMPLDQFLDITRAYLAQDAQFQQMMKLATSPASKSLVLDVESEEPFKKILAYVQENGLDMYYLVNKFNEALQLPPYKPLAFERQISGGIDGYITDVAAIMPVQDMMKVIEEKREQSQAFAGLIKIIISPEFGEFFQSTTQSETYLKLKNTATDFGIDEEHFSTYYGMFLMLIPILAA